MDLLNAFQSLEYGGSIVKSWKRQSSTEPIQSSNSFSRARTLSSQCRKVERFVGGSEAFVRRLGKQHILVGHQGCVNTLSWNSSGDLIASGSDDCKVMLWNWHSGNLVQSYYTGHMGNIFSVKFVGNNESQIASCAADGAVVLCDLSTSKTNKLFDGDSMLYKIVVDPFNPFVFYVCGEDGKIRQFDTRSQHCEILLSTNQGDGRNSVGRFSVGINSFAIHELKPYNVVVGGSDPLVRIFDRRKVPLINGYVNRFIPEQLTSKKCNENLIHITSVALDYSGTEIAVSYSGDHVYLLNVNGPQAPSEENSIDMNINETDENKNSSKTDNESSMSDYESDEEEYNKNEIYHGSVQYTGHLNVRTVKEVNFFGPRSEYIMSGSDDGRIFIWSKKTQKIVNVLKGDRHIVNVLQGHPSGYPILATSGIESNIKVWAPIEPEMCNLNDSERIAETNKHRLDTTRVLPTSMILNLLRFFGAAAEDEDDDENDDDDDDEDEDKEGEDESDEYDDDDDDDSDKIVFVEE